jgi:hypothetical protein
MNQRQKMFISIVVFFITGDYQALMTATYLKTRTRNNTQQQYCHKEYHQPIETKEIQSIYEHLQQLHHISQVPTHVSQHHQQ